VPGKKCSGEPGTGGGGRKQESEARKTVFVAFVESAFIRVHLRFLKEVEGGRTPESKAPVQVLFKEFLEEAVQGGDDGVL